MAENIELNKNNFNKRPYNKVIDTSFNQLGISNIQEQLDAQPTVQEFFNLYNELFYQINELGSINSHEYVVKTSGEYISFEEKDELIEALQLEIATIRKELLGSQQELANALLPIPEDVDALPEVEDIEVEPIPNPVVDKIETPLSDEPTSPSTANPLHVEFHDNITKTNGDYEKGLGTGQIYERVPITANQLKKNLLKMNQDGTLPYPNKYGDSLDKLNKAINDGDTSYWTGVDRNGVTIFNYMYRDFSKWRTVIKSNTNKGDKRDNLYTVVSKTVDTVLAHYRKDFNFNESGGYLP